MGAEARKTAEQREDIGKRLNALAGDVLNVGENGERYGLTVRRVSVTIEVEDPRSKTGHILATIYAANDPEDEPEDEPLMLLHALESVSSRLGIAKEALVECIMGQPLKFVKVPPKGRRRTPSGPSEPESRPSRSIGRPKRRRRGR